MMAAAEAATAAPVAEGITQVILGALTLAVLAVGAVFAGVIARRSKETAEAVHDTDGATVTELIVQRVDDLDTRVTRHGARLTEVEQSTAKAHLKINALMGTAHAPPGGPHGHT